MWFAVGECAATGEEELGDSIAGDEETREDGSGVGLGDGALALTLPQAASSTAAQTNTATCSTGLRRSTNHDARNHVTRWRLVKRPHGFDAPATRKFLPAIRRRPPDLRDRGADLVETVKDSPIWELMYFGHAR